MFKKITTTVALLISLATYGQIPTNGLVGHYPFDGNANDLSTNAINGLIEPGVIDAADKNFNSKKALYFPNKTGNGDGSGVLLNNNAIYNFSSSFSINLWFKYDGGTNIYDYQFLVGKGRDVQNSYGMSFIPSTKLFRFFHVKSTGNYYSAEVSLPGLNMSDWHNIAGVLDVNQNTISLFIDNNLVAAKTFSGMNVSLTNTNPVSIGYHEGDGYYDYPFNGFIDNVLFYDRALTPCEISSIYNSNGINIPCIAKPKIQFTDNQLKVVNSITGVSYQWSLDNNTLPGENSAIVNGSLQSGEYKVAVTSPQCQAVSDPAQILILDVVTVTNTPVVTVTNNSVVTVTNNCIVTVTNNIIVTVTSINIVKIYECPIITNEDKKLENNYLNIYPNPVSGFISVNSPQKSIGKIELYSIDGKILLITSQLNKIDISIFPAGFYMLLAYDLEGELFKKAKLSFE